MNTAQTRSNLRPNGLIFRAICRHSKNSFEFSASSSREFGYFEVTQRLPYCIDKLRRSVAVISCYSVPRIVALEIARIGAALLARTVRDAAVRWMRNWLTRQASSSKTPATARSAVASKPVSRTANAGAHGSRGGVDAYDGVHPDYDLTVRIFPTPKGNDGFLLHERISGETAVVDPMDAGPIVALARAHGCGIHHVLNTHHHNCAANLIGKLSA